MKSCGIGNSRLHPDLNVDIPMRDDDSGRTETEPKEEDSLCVSSFQWHCMAANVPRKLIVEHGSPCEGTEHIEDMVMSFLTQLASAGRPSRVHGTSESGSEDPKSAARALRSKSRVELQLADRSKEREPGLAILAPRPPSVYQFRPLTVLPVSSPSSIRESVLQAAQNLLVTECVHLCARLTYLVPSSALSSA